MIILTNQCVYSPSTNQFQAYTIMSQQKGVLYRDEIKKRKEDEQLIDDLITDGVSFLRFVHKHPEMWADERMAEACDLAYKITGNPTKFHRYEEKQWGESTDVLSKDVAQKLSDREFSITKPSENIIHLQITHAVTEWKSGTLALDGNDDINVNFRKWKFEARDGDEKSIILRVDSTLNTAGNTLVAGVIVKIKSFLPVYFRYDDNSEQKMAIVVRDFEVVGQQPLPPEAKGVPNDRVKPVASIHRKKAKSSRQTYSYNTQNKGNNHNSQKKGNDDNANEKTDEYPNNKKCECNGEQCSKHGVEFVMCLTKCVPVESVSLALVARDCVFATRSLNEMSPSDKRFLLYYYYATTIYQFHGKGNRVKLPECLKAAIRALHPDDKDMDVAHLLDTNEEDANEN